ncbi:ATPase, T2SS/T4P/T4SS family [Desulfoscipio gibsoniae]
MGLEFDHNDWSEQTETQKEKIVQEIAINLSKQHPDLFTGKVKDFNPEPLIRQAVMTRKDLVQSEIEDVVQAIMGQATGYGPLAEFFIGPDAQEITEVMINPSPDGPKIFYGKHGKHWPTTKKYFKDNEEATRFCQKICEDAGRTFTADNPIVDAWMKDGSRIAVMSFKASPLGTAATIRKSPLVRPPLNLSKLVEYEMLPIFAKRFIVDLLVSGQASIAFCGRTDSGKTTFMRACGEFINLGERIIISETSFELAFPNLPNCINLVEVSYGNNVLVDMTLLCKTINRNNPDRAMVGELRSGEILAASQIAASTSGGFWTSLHAGNIFDLKGRIHGMFFEGGMKLDKDFLDDKIRSMFNYVIFMDKDRDKKRAVTQIVEVTPNGYNSILKLDMEKYTTSGGKTRRWIYENTVTPEGLANLAFRGANITPEYQTIKNKYLYTGGEGNVT